MEITGEAFDTGNNVEYLLHNDGDTSSFGDGPALLPSLLSESSVKFIMQGIQPYSDIGNEKTYEIVLSKTRVDGSLDRVSTRFLQRIVAGCQIGMETDEVSGLCTPCAEGYFKPEPGPQLCSAW